MTNKEKPLEWIASSHKDLMALPSDVRRRFGYALSLAQIGDQDDAAKVLKGFGGAGVLEVVEDDAGGTYRAVYTVKFAEAVFVLHCFQKKSKSGIATPKADMDIIRVRLKVAEALARGQRLHPVFFMLKFCYENVEKLSELSCDPDLRECFS